MRHLLRILPLLVIVLLILYLTLQTPEQTWALTHAIQNFLLRLFPDGTAPNWITDGKLLRHAAHIPEYFLLGLALCVVFADKKNSLLLTLTLGLLIGLCDESLKILLPTREFSLPDLTLDAIGIATAVAVFEILVSLKIAMTKKGNEM